MDLKTTKGFFMELVILQRNQKASEDRFMSQKTGLKNVVQLKLDRMTQPKNQGNRDDMQDPPSWFQEAELIHGNPFHLKRTVPKK